MHFSDAADLQALWFHAVWQASALGHSRIAAVWQRSTSKAQWRNGKRSKRIQIGITQPENMPSYAPTAQSAKQKHDKACNLTKADPIGSAFVSRQRDMAWWHNCDSMRNRGVWSLRRTLELWKFWAHSVQTSKGKTEQINRDQTIAVIALFSQTTALFRVKMRIVHTSTLVFYLELTSYIAF